MLKKFPEDPRSTWRSRSFGRADALRPPWTDEARIRQSCISCGECIAACPEAILTPGPAGTPTVNFAAGACTFCSACAAACPEEVFADTAGPPWDLAAVISRDCLLHEGVSCRSCIDSCEEGALRFDIRAGSVGAIRVVRDACTGCGACIGMCPVDAITLSHAPSRQMEAVE